MKIITKNFRLNALANQYSAAIYDHVKQQNGGDFFMVDAGEFPLRIEIAGGVSGVRALVDAYYLEALKLYLLQWEKIAIEMLTKCLKENNSVTDAGIKIWESMGSDIGYTVAGGAQ